MDSTTEKLLEDLREEEHFWRTARWGYLIASVIPIAGYIWVIWKLHDIIQLLKDLFDENSLEVAFYVTIVASATMVTAAVGGLGLGYVIKNWKGNRTKQLLISTTERVLKGN